MKIKNKRIIVTGAGSGIGRDLTLQLLKKGAYVIGIDINEEELNKTKELTKGDFDAYVVNIADDESINNFKKECAEKYSNIDCLINNAGIIQPFINFSELEMDIIYKVMNVNFFGPLKLTKLFLPIITKSNDGHIVNISSMGGFFPFPGQSIYGASKAAMKLFTEALYAELLNTNIHVTIVFPGAINTNIAKNSNAEIKVKKGNGSIKMLSSSLAAEQIIKGMEKNKFQMFVGSDSKAMNFMYKLNPKSAIKFINEKMQVK